MKNLFIFVCLLSFLSSSGGLILNALLYFKDKQKMFREGLIYNVGLFLLVFSVFLNEYFENFLSIINIPWSLETFKDLCIIAYVLIIFRITLLINRKEMKGKYLKTSVFLFFYYIVLWQIVHIFHENYCVYNDFCIYHNFLFFLSLASEYVLINIFPLICCVIILKNAHNLVNIIHRNYIMFSTIISILMFILIPVYKFFVASNNDLHLIIVDVLAGYLIIHMTALLYFGIKFFAAESNEVSKEAENQIEIIDYQTEIDIFEKHNISPREKEIIKKLKLGFSNCEIAEKLFITENTVKKHIGNIYAKVQVNNRSKLLNIFK